MYKSLENISVNLSENDIKLFNCFCDYFLEYNSKINLISKNDSKYLYEKHIYDSLAFNLFYKKYLNDKTIKLLDIGTGGGFPAIPVSMYYKYINVTALDSINKKIKFIESVKDELKLTNLTTVCSRVEELNQKLRESFDIVTSRAMARLNIILEYAIPFLKTGGYFVAYKSIKADEEINEAQNALKLLKSEVIDKIKYELPLDEDNKRILIIVKKLSATSAKFPRQNGLVKKKPL